MIVLANGLSASEENLLEYNLIIEIWNKKKVKEVVMNFLGGKCMTFPECITCTDIQHCKIEMRQKGVNA